MRGWAWVWRHRWFVLGIICVGVNTWGVARWTADGRGVSVRRFTAGANGVVAGRDELTWRFSAPLVDPGVVDRGEIPDLLDLTPHVPGRLRWRSTRELVFQPTELWPPCTSFAAMLRDEVCPPSGRPLDLPRVFTFASEALRLTEVGECDTDASGHVTIRLGFTAPPKLDALAGFLEFRTAAGTKLPYSVPTQPPTREVRVRLAPTAERALTVVLAQATPPDTGTLGTGQAVALALTLSPKLVLTRLRGESPAFGDSRITAEFNCRVDAASAVESIRVTPPVAFSVFTEDGWQRSHCALVGAFLPGHAYRVQVRRGLRAANGRLLETDVDRRIVMPDRVAGLRIDATGHYLSPRGNMRLPVVTAGIDTFAVTAERVYANNLVQYWMRRRARYAGYYGCDDRHHADIGAPVGEDAYTPGRGDGSARRTAVDLRGLLAPHASGAFFVRAVAGEHDAGQLIAIGDTGISALRSADSLLVWANSLHTLQSVTGATVRLFSTANQELATGVTADDGLARLQGAFATPENEPFLVTVERGDDLAFLCLDGTQVAMPGDTGGAPYAGDAPEAFVYTDRGIYRPGETGHLAAVVRDARLACAAPFPLTLKVARPDGMPFLGTNQVLHADGTAAIALPIPVHAMTGRYTCQALLPDGTALGAASFLVEEFIPPRIKADVRVEPTRVRDRLTALVSARHLFGRAAAGLPASVDVSLQSRTFTTDRWPGYVFADAERPACEQVLKLGTKGLDAAGQVSFDATLPAMKPPSAMQALVCATVKETNGRAVTARHAVPVDCYPRYVGVRPPDEGAALRAGRPMTLAVALVTPEGEGVSGAAMLEGAFSRVAWSSVLEEQDDGTYRYRSERRLEPVAALRVPVIDGVAVCEVCPPVGGQFIIQVSDPDGGASASLSVYVSDTDSPWQPWAQDRPGVAELAFDKDRYAPGETASLLVKSPFAGKALVSICRDRVLETHVVAIDGNTATLPIPVRRDYGPNAYCVVTVIRAVAVPVDLDTAPTWSPHRAVGVAPLIVDDDTGRLTVTLEAPATASPAAPLPLRLTVRDVAGQPAPCRLTVAAVDEGICLLTSMPSPDPFAFFRRKRALGAALHDLYSLLMPETALAVQADAAAPGGDDAAAMGGRLNPIRARRYVPTALWVQDIETDAAGHAEVTLDLPEFTGRLRVMAVSAGPGGVGSGVAAVEVKRPVVVLTSLPRFLAPGDVCALPIAVLNESGAPASVALDVSVDGPLALRTPSGLDVRRTSFAVACEVGAEARVGATLAAASAPGVARVTVVARTNGVAFFRETAELAVRPISPRVAAVTNGCLAAGGVCRVPLSRAWLAGTDTHRVTCAGLPVPQLEGALDYLLAYPYGCLEQTVSGAFPLLYAGALLRHRESVVMTRDGLTAYVDAGIARVLSMQRRAGDFSYWPQSGEVYRWGSVYATHFLVEAKAAGYRVPEGALDAALDALGAMLECPLESEGGNEAAWLPSELGLRAYVCHVMALAGRRSGGWLDRLLELRGDVDAGATGWLAAALTVSGRRRDAHALLTSGPDGGPGVGPAGGADGAVRLSGDLSSPVRARAMLLSAWLDVDPRDPAAPELAADLLRRQRWGRWRNTQDNAYALMALGKYAERLSVGDETMQGAVAWTTAEGAAHGVTVTGRVPVAVSPAADAVEVTVTNAGPGALYWSVVSVGVPTNRTPEPVQAGLVVRREWLDVEGRPLNGRVRQGDLAIVRLTVDAPDGMVPNVAVQDLLPAGMEIENARLATAQIVPWVRTADTLRPRHIEIRDDRLLLFLAEHQGGGSFCYAVRAVTPGTFVVPPVMADCMYDEAVRGIGETGALVVEDEDDEKKGAVDGDDGKGGL